jgi:hypothetical protein
MAQVMDGRTMSVGEILGGAAQDSNGAQLKFEQIKVSYPPVFEAKGTDNKIYSFEMTSISVRLSIRSISSSSWFLSNCQGSWRILRKVLKLDSMIEKKDGKDKLENLVFEIFVFFTPFIYRAQILPAAGVRKTQLLLPDMLFVFLRPHKIPPEIVP